MTQAQVNEIDAYCNLLNIASLYTDIATYDFHEVLMYAGEQSYNLYAKAVRKSGWTARGVAPMLKVAQGTFGETQQHEVLRSADYWGFSWIHWKTPEIVSATNYQARWTPKLGFYIIDNVEVDANEMPLCNIYPEAMDFESELLVEEGKYEGLMQLIGMRDDLVNPYASELTWDTTRHNYTLPSRWITTPLSAWFTKKHNDHLPVAALSFNTILFKVQIRQLSEVLVVDQIVDDGAGRYVVDNIQPVLIPQTHLLTQNPQMQKVQSYGIVVQMPNRDRKVLAKTQAIQLLIQQHQRVVNQYVDVHQKFETVPIDTRFVYPVRALMFGMRNATIPAEWGNWGAQHTVPLVRNGQRQLGVNFNPAGQVNPVGAANIKYDNQTRVAFTSDLFDKLVPYLSCVRVPRAVGYNVWSYSADLAGNQPDGSVNFSRVSQPSITIRHAPEITTNTNDSIFNLHIIAVNWNHLKITLGTSSFSAN